MVEKLIYCLVSVVLVCYSVSYNRAKASEAFKAVFGLVLYFYIHLLSFGISSNIKSGCVT